MVTCMTCYGEGIIITCCDDMCFGLGHCIHGDGEEICPECYGEGEVDDELDDFLDWYAMSDITCKEVTYEQTIRER